MPEKSLREVYRDAVINVAQPAVFFIDQNRLTNDPHYNALEIGKQYNEQFPDEPGMNADNPEHVAFAKNLSVSQSGPDAGPSSGSPRERPFGADKCFVTDLGTGWETKQKIVANITGINEKYLREAPGTTEDYVEQTGEHEGEHCNQPVSQSHLDIVKAEVGAEQKSYAGLYARGKLDVLDTVKSAATVNAAHDIDHATTIKLNADGSVDEKDYKSIQDVRNFIASGAATSKGLTSEDLITNMEIREPRMYNNMIKSMIKEGVYDDVPEQKAKIQEYVTARDALMVPEEQLADTAKAATQGSAVTLPKSGI